MLIFLVIMTRFTNISSLNTSHYIISTIESKKELVYKNSATKVLKAMLLKEQYSGRLEIAKMMYMFLDKVLMSNSALLKEIFTEIWQYYLDTCRKEDDKIPLQLKEKEVMLYIQSYHLDENKAVKVSAKELFENPS
jgi:hypothetical protein